MNTKPDDTTLALWLDDELEGEPLAKVEAWAKEHPGQFEAREEIRRWRTMIGESLPAIEEPPAAEFFNERIQHAIREVHHQPASAGLTSLRQWWMPLAACAGMAAAFLLGMNSQPLSSDTSLSGNDDGPASYTNVYTPEQGVEAEYFTSTNASATVIVLSGVDAIPDSVDFFATASNPRSREIDSTAGMKPETDSVR